MALAIGTLVGVATGVSPAVAADTAAAAASDELNEVVITGSQIRGIAPVGSPVIALDRDSIEKSGVANANDLLRQIPAVTNYGADDSLAGGTAIQNSILNITLARSINLRGLGTASTLTLLDGHRVAPGGPNAVFIDADTVPSAAVERMEVIADGASAIYGSDAVAGVVNMVLRRNFTGAETTLRGGRADGTSQWLASQIFGKGWGSGHVTVTLEKSRRSALAAGDRPDLYTDNLTRFGGPNGTVQAAPGNITFGGVSYGIPTGQAGSNFLLSQLNGTANIRSVWQGRDATPRQDRTTALVTVDQKVGEGVDLYFDGVYSKRDFSYISTQGAAANLSIPAANPFSPCATGKVTTNSFGITCTANLTVPYSFVNDLGLGQQTGGTKVYDVTVGARVAIAGSWKLETSATRSVDDELRDTINAINNNAVTVVTQGTATYKGVTTVKPSTVPYFNPFCGNTSGCNDPTTLAYIRGISHQGSEFSINDYKLKADGSLFSIPGGDVKLAIGAEYHTDHMYNFNDNTTGGQSVADYVHIPTARDRQVTSYFAEAYIPIVGAGNAMRGLQRLDLSLAGRTENYSDFGRTTNPKVGLTWEPVKGLEINGTYGKSFRAPTLCDINPECTVRYLNAAPLTAAQLAAIAAGSTGTVGITGNKNYIQTGGGSEGLQPETATTYSFGFNIKPTLLPGFQAGLSYYHINFINRIDTPGEATPAVSILANPAAYRPLVVLNPAYFPQQAGGNPFATTAADFNAYLAAIAVNPNVTSTIATANVLGVVLGNRFNTGVVKTDGFDLTSSFDWHTGFGDIRAGLSGTYVTSYLSSRSPQIPIAESVNHFSFPLRFKARAELGWRNAHWNATTFINYANAYTIDTAFLPTVTTPSNYNKVNAYTTVDLTVNYNTGDQHRQALLNGLRFSLSAQNLFDRAPPLVLNGTNLLFDPQNASATGRYLSLQLTKTW